VASSQGAIGSGSRAATPEDQTSGATATIASARNPAHVVQRRPTIACRPRTKSCVAAITCSASHAKKAARSALVDAASVFQSEKYGRWR
jgi:hypothetical protein